MNQLPIPSHPSHLITDSSKLKTFLDCERRFFYKYLLGWRPNGLIHNLTFGTCWHLAKEHIRLNGYTEQDALDAYELFINRYREDFAPETDEDYQPKTPGAAKAGLIEYVNKWREHDRDYETLYTEIGGHIPIMRDRTITYRLDSIVRTPEGIISFDDKTSKMKSYTWAQLWQLDIQMNIYLLVLKILYYNEETVYGINVDGAIFRKGGREFLRVPVIKNDDQMNTFFSELHHWIDMLDWNLRVLEEQDRDSNVMMLSFPRRPSSCMDYGRLCDFHHMCTSWNNPLQFCQKPPIGFKVEFWNPLADENKPDPKHIIDGDESKVKNLTGA